MRTTLNFKSGFILRYLMAKTLVHPTDEMKARMKQFEDEPALIKIFRGVMYCNPEALNGVPKTRTTLAGLLYEAESLRDFNQQSFKAVMHFIEHEPQYRGLREKVCLLACAGQIARNCKSERAISYALEVAQLYGQNALENALQQSQAHLEENPEFLIDWFSYKLKTMGRVPQDTLPYQTAN